MADRKKKRNIEIKKIEYLENEKIFLVEISIYGLSFGEKMKNSGHKL